MKCLRNKQHGLLGFKTRVVADCLLEYRVTSQTSNLMKFLQQFSFVYFGQKWECLLFCPSGEITMKLKQPWKSSLADHTSPAYKILSGNLATAVSTITSIFLNESLSTRPADMSKVDWDVGSVWWTSRSSPCYHVHPETLAINVMNCLLNTAFQDVPTATLVLT